MDDAYQILEYLPINDLEIKDYVEPLLISARVTYEQNEYQFSYFAIHLIFMTFIYSTVWKISQFHKDKYEYSLLFARPYHGKTINFKEIKTIFDFSHMPEKDIFEFFSLIDIDNGYINSTKGLIDYRNDMAHANGKRQINSEEEFDDAINEIISVVQRIHEGLKRTIRESYRNILIIYAKSGFSEEFSSPDDFISEEFLNNLNFSQKDLKVCKEFGLNKLKNRKESGLTKDEIDRVIEFHESLTKQYLDLFDE